VRKCIGGQQVGELIVYVRDRRRRSKQRREQVDRKARDEDNRAGNKRLAHQPVNAAPNRDKGGCERWQRAGERGREEQDQQRKKCHSRTTGASGSWLAGQPRAEEELDLKTAAGHYCSRSTGEWA
jgi:hypothetical protein